MTFKTKTNHLKAAISKRQSDVEWSVFSQSIPFAALQCRIPEMMLGQLSIIAKEKEMSMDEVVTGLIATALNGMGKP